MSRKGQAFEHADARTAGSGSVLPYGRSRLGPYAATGRQAARGGSPLWRLKPGAAAAHAREQAEDRAEDPEGRASDGHDGGAVSRSELLEVFESLLEAWHDHVPAEPASTAALRAELEDRLQTLERAWDQTVQRDGPHAAAPAPDEPPVSATEPPQAPAAVVNTALHETDQHETELDGHPEWRLLQTVRGAVRHLWDTLRERAADYWGSFRADLRFQGFWKAVSIRACEAIAGLALNLADKIERSTAGELPTAEALLGLGDAAITYSQTAGSAKESTPTGAGQETPSARTRQQTDGARREAPLPYASREEAMTASREVARAFDAWLHTSMGQEVRASDHPRVTAFREAWRSLPATNLPDGPGPAAGPYGEVAERAEALAEAATTASGRFTTADIKALRELSQAATDHAGRLTATLPPGTAGPAAANRRADAPPPQRRPRVATGGPAPQGPRPPRASA